LEDFMTTGTWDPTAGADRAITVELITPFLALSEQQLNELSAHLPLELVQSAHWIMKRTLADWQPVAEQLDDHQIRHLVRFFTLAEEQLPGWQAGDTSPVIWLCRILKQRGQFPDKELTRWIKEHTKNRFLPYGSVL
jgi:hypothetical protein